MIEDTGERVRLRDTWREWAYGGSFHEVHGLGEAEERGKEMSSESQCGRHCERRW